jgi:2-polyprenyl-3-methyl-5-hydroxy-6-metoxy-1,4-benzoquinol methylase
MKEMWNKRYAESEFAYGVNANSFFKSKIDIYQPGTILLPAEGEGRNAVYAARNYWDVYAFDFSEEARKKAMLLAKENNVKINYFCSSFQEIELPWNFADCLALIFIHIPDEIRTRIHRKMLNYLRPGGKIILEAFSKEQIDKSSGGPKDVSMLYSEEELREDFKSLTEMKIELVEENLDEGSHHSGIASLIRLTGIK